MYQRPVPPFTQRKDGLEGHQGSQPSLPSLPDDVPPTQHTAITTNKLKAFLCTSLHGLLVAMHIALVVICIHHYEHAVTIDLNDFSTTWVPLIVNVVSQVVATLYLALLVLVTQRLALRRNLLTRQTLTSIHDKSNAWLGIGSALTSVWQQARLPAAPWGVSSVALYLAGVSTVHVTMTNLFHVIPYNATLPTTWTTKLANASFTTGEVSSYDILLFYNQFTTIGLIENMVYDIIPSVPSAIGNTTVNASTYEVDCAAVPQARQISESLSNGSPADPNAIMIFSLDSDGTTANVSVPVPYYPAVYAANVTITSCNSPDTSTPGGSCWKPIVMAATVPIIDSSGSEPPSDPGPWKPIVPRVLQPLVIDDSTDEDNATSAVITGVQLVACSVSIKDVKINISAETQQSYPVPLAPMNTQWTNWTWPQDLTLYDPRLLSAQTAPGFSPASGHSNSISIIAASINDTNATAPIMVGGIDPTDPLAMEIISDGMDVVLTPTAFDVFITEDVGLTSGSGENLNVSLANLNRSLGRALAAIAWYGSNINYSNIHAASDVLQGQNQLNPLLVPTDPQLVRPTGEATVMVQVLIYRLNLSLVPVIVGLAVSSMLFVLSFILTGQTFFSRGLIYAHTVLDGSGVLQITWLLGNEPHLSKVRKPEVRMLRVAGMFDVKMNERAEEKVLRAAAGEDAESVVFPHTRQESS